MVYARFIREREAEGHDSTGEERTYACVYISTVSHSLSSGKFIRANIRDAVKVTLFNVHPLRETSVHTRLALSTSFQTAFSRNHTFLDLLEFLTKLNQESSCSTRNRREKLDSNGGRSEKPCRAEEGKERRRKDEGKRRSRKLVGVILETGFFDELFQGRNALPTQHPIAVRINAIIRSARKGLRGHGMRVNVVINKSRSS